MIDWLLEFDRSLFIVINALPHNRLLNGIGLFFSLFGSFGLIWYIMTIFIVVREKKKDLRLIWAMVLGGGLSLLFVTFIFKPLIQRERPYVTLPDETIVVTSRYFLETIMFTDPYAFPSGHTTIAFVGAYLLSRKWRKQTFWFYLLAVAIAFSRIYLGKHYPFDVLGGMALGSCIGWMVWRIIAVRRKGYR